MRTGLYIDREYMEAQYSTSTNVWVVRRAAQGQRSAHAANATVYVGRPQDFSFSLTDPSGNCAPGDQALPLVVVWTGDVFDCPSTGKGWTLSAIASGGPLPFTDDGSTLATTRSLSLSSTTVNPNGGVDCKDTSGSTTAYTCTPTPAAIGAYSTGMIVILVPQTANSTASPTLALAGLAAKNLKTSAGTALAVGALAGGTPYNFEYDGTQFVLAGGGSSAATQTLDLLSGPKPIGTKGSAKYEPV